MRIKTLKRLIAEDGKILRNKETGRCVGGKSRKVGRNWRYWKRWGGVNGKDF